jgi:hypothetical protein
LAIWGAAAKNEKVELLLIGGACELVGANHEQALKRKSPKVGME